MTVWCHVISLIQEHCDFAHNEHVGYVMPFHANTFMLNPLKTSVDKIPGFQFPSDFCANKKIHPHLLLYRYPCIGNVPHPPIPHNNKYRVRLKVFKLNLKRENSTAVWGYMPREEISTAGHDKQWHGWLKT